MAHQAELGSCIDECLKCMRVCAEALAHCIEKGGKHAAPEHVTLMQDCVEICDTSARFMMRGSTLHTATCAACADVCTACADDCQKMSDDPEMKSCADACRRCAESCRRMAA